MLSKPWRHQSDELRKAEARLDSSRSLRDGLRADGEPELIEEVERQLNLQAGLRLGKRVAPTGCIDELRKARISSGERIQPNFHLDAAPELRFAGEGQ